MNRNSNEIVIYRTKDGTTKIVCVKQKAIDETQALFDSLMYENFG